MHYWRGNYALAGILIVLCPIQYITHCIKSPKHRVEQELNIPLIRGPIPSQLANSFWPVHDPWEHKVEVTPDVILMPAGQVNVTRAPSSTDDELAVAPSGTGTGGQRLSGKRMCNK